MTLFSGKVNTTLGSEQTIQLQKVNGYGEQDPRQVWSFIRLQIQQISVQHQLVTAGTISSKEVRTWNLESMKF
jgi:FKBP-type peptidyl-prolyl cis-trans isomerase 2